MAGGGPGGGCSGGSQWEIWFQTGTRSLHNNDTFQAMPDSTVNPAFDFALKPGFSLLQKEILQADESPRNNAAAQYSEQVSGSEGQTIGCKV